MLILRNGRGALGSKLSAIIQERHLSHELKLRPRAEIYHTWNIDDKSETTQAIEFEKFSHFLKSREASLRLIFVSTKSKADDWYVHYKQQAEVLALATFTETFVIRIPTIIGKGSLAGIRNGSLTPWGCYELIDLQAAANAVFDLVNYNGLRRIHEVSGTTVPAKIIKSLFTDVPTNAPSDRST